VTGGGGGKMRRNFCEINDSVAWKNGMRGVFIVAGNGREVGDREKKFSSLLQPSPRSLNLLIRAIPIPLPTKNTHQPTPSPRYYILPSLYTAHAKTF